MGTKKLINVHEPLEYLENLDMFSEDDLSENEDFISRVKLLILTLNNDGDRDTDEDSEDKNELWKWILSHEYYCIIKLFLAHTKMEKICVESNNYVHLKGNHMFSMTEDKLKAFLTILSVSGYTGLPRQEMYWERREDCHNPVVSTMVTKTKFLEWERFLNLADNNALNSSDKFGNFQPLFNIISK